MENGDVTIVFSSFNAQPELLYNVKRVEIKRDNVLVVCAGYNKVFFKNTIKSITTSGDVKIMMK